MAEPASTSLIVTGIALSLAGTGVSIMAQMQQGKEQKAWSNYNAAVAERDAETARTNAAYEAGLKRKEGEKILGRQRALFAKRGVTFEGSPLLLMEQTAADIEMDALMIERGGKVAGQRYQSEAVLSRMEGTAAKRAGYYGAGTTLLTGVGQAATTYGMYAKPSSAKKT